jgi:hypothetical protein
LALPMQSARDGTRTASCPSRRRSRRRSDPTLEEFPAVPAIRDDSTNIVTGERREKRTRSKAHSIPIKSSSSCLYDEGNG